MTSHSKRLGDEAEREAAPLLAELLGRPLRRKLGAGRHDDRGDLDGLDDTVLQVAYWPAGTLASYVVKPADAEDQRIRSGVAFAASVIRHKGGLWRIAMTPEQWATLWLAAHES